MSKKNKGPNAPLTITRQELLVNNSDADFRYLVHHLLALSGVMESIRIRFAEYIGLSGIQYTILVCIAHLDTEHNGVSIKNIAKHLALSGAFITIETGKLNKQGLVTKVKNPEDRRSVQVKVTHEGNKLLTNLASIQQQVNDRFFDSLSKKDLKYLNTLFDLLVKDALDASALLTYLVTTDKAVNQK